VEALKLKIEELNAEIEAFQAQLPEHGTPSIHRQEQAYTPHPTSNKNLGCPFFSFCNDSYVIPLNIVAYP
jgi:hypothetical protein